MRRDGATDGSSEERQVVTKGLQKPYQRNIGFSREHAQHYTVLAPLPRRSKISVLHTLNHCSLQGSLGVRSSQECCDHRQSQVQCFVQGREPETHKHTHTGLEARTVRRQKSRKINPNTRLRGVMSSRRNSSQERIYLVAHRFAGGGGSYSGEPQDPIQRSGAHFADRTLARHKSEGQVH